MVFIDFSGFESPKIRPKSTPKRIRKTHRKKTSQNSILASGLASQNLPKSTRIAPKSVLKRSLFRDAMETVGKSTEVNGTHRL